jgi:hypothetical protein
MRHSSVAHFQHARGPRKLLVFIEDFGAGEGNRTLVISLEGCCSTIELHPRTGVTMWGAQSVANPSHHPLPANRYLAGNFPETTLLASSRPQKRLDSPRACTEFPAGSGPVAHRACSSKIRTGSSKPLGLTVSTKRKSKPPAARSTTASLTRISVPCSLFNASSRAARFTVAPSTV